MNKKQIENAISDQQPVYWHEVTLKDNRWHLAKVVEFDATKRLWRIQTSEGLRCVRPGDLFPQIVARTCTGEVFLGADGVVYRNGSASTQNFQEPLIELWHQVHKGKQPIEVQHGSTVWKRDALLVMAHACGRRLQLDKSEEYGLPNGGTYADLASKIDGQLLGRRER